MLGNNIFKNFRQASIISAAALTAQQQMVQGNMMPQLQQQQNMQQQMQQGNMLPQHVMMHSHPMHNNGSILISTPVSSLGRLSSHPSEELNNPLILPPPIGGDPMGVGNLNPMSPDISSHLPMPPSVISMTSNPNISIASHPNIGTSVNPMYNPHSSSYNNVNPHFTSISRVSPEGREDDTICADGIPPLELGPISPVQ